MKCAALFSLSFLLTFVVSWNAYSRKKQFYPTIIYLTHHQPSLTVLLLQCCVLLFIVAKLVTRIFFGRLHQAEIDNLVSQSWYTFFDMCLVFAFFQDELGTEFLFLFSLLLVARAFHWLLEDRVDYMERTPVITALFHLRIMSLVFILGCIDASFIRAYWMSRINGLSVQLALGIEYCILLLSLVSIAVRYALHSIDSMREHPWDKKRLYLSYLDIVVGVVRLVLYVEFTLIMWALHPFPLFIARPIYLSVRTLKKAVHDVLMSRRAIRYMNTVFRNATAADLAASSDTVCIICREEMHVQPDSVADSGLTLKRLPCSHIFHINCLRSWFQRQQSCPTCRMDIIRQARQQEIQANRQRGSTSSSATSVTSTSTTVTHAAASLSSINTSAADRLPWMSAMGSAPFVSPFTNPFLPTSMSQSSSMPFSPLPPPIFSSPFVGMPIVYPGNLFASPTSPLPEPPTSSPDSIDETRLRASAEARFTALRQINVLLNAAVLQMNAYLNAASTPSAMENTWLSALSKENTDTLGDATITKTNQTAATSTIKSESNLQNDDDKPVEYIETLSKENELTKVRQRRLERLTGQMDLVNNETPSD